MSTFELHTKLQPKVDIRTKNLRLKYTLFICFVLFVVFFCSNDNKTTRNF